jgi:hypothetical protein
MLDDDSLDRVNRVLHRLGPELAEGIRRISPGIDAIRGADGSWDTYEVLKWMDQKKLALEAGNGWTAVFARGVLDPHVRVRDDQRADERFRQQALIKEMRWWRNAEAHQHLTSPDDILRALDGAERLLRAVGRHTAADEVCAEREKALVAEADRVRAHGWGHGITHSGPPSARVTCIAFAPPWYAVMRERVLMFDRATDDEFIEMLTRMAADGDRVIAGLPAPVLHPPAEQHLVQRVREAGYALWPFDPPLRQVAVGLSSGALLERLQPIGTPPGGGRVAFLASEHARDLRLGRDTAARLLADSTAFDAVFGAWALSSYGDPIPDESRHRAGRAPDVGRAWMPE